MSKADRLYVALQEDGELKTPRLPADTPANIVSPPIATEEISLEREDMDLEETVGSRAPTAREYGGRVYEGDIELAARPDTFPVFLSMVLGAPVSTEVVTGVYRHVWNPIAADIEPLPASIWTVNRDVTPNVVDKYVGAKGNEMSIEIEANGYLMSTIGVAAYLLDQTATEPTGIAQDLTKKWAFHQVTAELAVGAGALASVPLLDFSLEYSNNIVTDLFNLGSKEVEALPPGNIEPEVTFTPSRDIGEHYRRALLDTPEDVRLKLVAQGAIITGVHRYALEVDLKRLQYIEAPVDIDAGETLTGVEVTAAPVLKESDNSFIEIAVVNSNDGDLYRPPAGA